MNRLAELQMLLTPPDPDAAQHLHDLAKAIGHLCSVAGCSGVQKAKGKCENHYRNARYQPSRSTSKLKPCAECGGPIRRRDGESAERFACRALCSRACAAAKGHRTQLERDANRKAAILEDLQWIAGTDSPEHIATRLGFTSVENLERQLHRWGRTDLITAMVGERAA